MGAVLGAFLGFGYWYYIGCTSGTCPLTSQWYTSSMFGALFGYLTTSMVYDIIEKKNNIKLIKDEQIQSDNK